MTVRKFDCFPSALESQADSNNAFAIIVPPAGPKPLLLSFKIWNVRFLVRKGTIGSADLPPNALSLKSSSTSEVRLMSELQMAVKACGISEIRRPVKTSAKSATFKALKV